MDPLSGWCVGDRHPEKTRIRRERMRPLALLVCALAATGCGGGLDHVKAPDSALGRVVVYRNGIAYYERRATPKEGKLELTVPVEKVDDFLKSLKVEDAAISPQLPVVAVAGTVTVMVSLAVML